MYTWQGQHLADPLTTDSRVLWYNEELFKQAGLDSESGSSGENLASDFAANDVNKVRYRRSLLDSTLFAVYADGEIAAHTPYDAWGKPQTETRLDVDLRSNKNELSASFRCSGIGN